MGLCACLVKSLFKKEKTLFFLFSYWFKKNILYRQCVLHLILSSMKKFKIIFTILMLVCVSWCSVSVDFDGAILERFTDKIAYLYNNCWSDIEWLQETLTPEAIQSMDQTCVASIKAITKIRWKIEKLKWRIWNSELVNQLLSKIDEIIYSLQTSKDEISGLYRENQNIDLWWIIQSIDWETVIQNLQELIENN